MRILFSSDDGIDSPGLGFLLEKTKLNKDLKSFIVAPSQDHSGKGSGISIRNPVKFTFRDSRTVESTGTPVDCIIFGIQTFLPELVVCGINYHPNLSSDVFLSSDLAMAFNAATFCPALVVSAVETVKGIKRGQTYALAALRAFWLIQLINARVLKVPKFTVLNLVVPANSTEIKVTRHSVFRFGDKFLPFVNPRGQEFHWLTYEFDERVNEKGLEGIDAIARGFTSLTPLSLDINAVAQGFASLTPLSLDMTSDFVTELKELLSK